MKKTILQYGLAAGSIVSALMLLSVNFLSHREGGIDYNTSMYIGYAAMLLALSLVYFGTKHYRDTHNGGYISFGKAFKIGMLISLVAATVYVIAWLIAYNFFMPDFMDQYSAHVIAEMKADGAGVAEIEKEKAFMVDFIRWYKNPFFNALMTYAEILPVGVFVTLISSILLKRRRNNDLQNS